MRPQYCNQTALTAAFCLPQSVFAPRTKGRTIRLATKRPRSLCEGEGVCRKGCKRVQKDAGRQTAKGWDRLGDGGTPKERECVEADARQARSGRRDNRTPGLRVKPFVDWEGQAKTHKWTIQLEGRVNCKDGKRTKKKRVKCRYAGCGAKKQYGKKKDLTEHSSSEAAAGSILRFALFSAVQSHLVSLLPLVWVFFSCFVRCRFCCFLDALCVMLYLGERTKISMDRGGRAGGRESKSTVAAKCSRVKTRQADSESTGYQAQIVGGCDREEAGGGDVIVGVARLASMGRR